MKLLPDLQGGEISTNVVSPYEAKRNTGYQWAVNPDFADASSGLRNSIRTE